MIEFSPIFLLGEIAEKIGYRTGTAYIVYNDNGTFRITDTREINSRKVYNVITDKSISVYLYSDGHYIKWIANEILRAKDYLNIPSEILTKDDIEYAKLYA